MTVAQSQAASWHWSGLFSTTEQQTSSIRLATDSQNMWTALGIHHHQTNSQVKLYIDKCNAQVLNLFIYLILPYMFQAFF
jgi:hypothetical protein